jgi:hypothetical protein
MERLRPVAYASKALTSREKKIANIEREMLAARFGAKRLHTYLCNRPFTILSDHKPLDMITKKPLHAAPPRLQSLIRDLEGYDYTIKYIPAVDIALADILSTLPNPHNQEDTKPYVKVFALLKFSTTRTQSLKEETQKDPVLNALKEVIHIGWPNIIKELPTDLRCFWTIHDELSVEDGIIMKGERIFIPTTM